jgi:mono/diheme cytochrome c family protein
MYGNPLMTLPINPVHFPSALLWLLAGTACLGAAPDNREPAMAMKVLRLNCVPCHNEEKRKGGLLLTTRAGLLEGGDEGVAILEGKPEESRLIQSLAAGVESHMPPKKQLPASQIKLLADWVRAGALWDEAALAGMAPAPRAVALAPVPAAYRPVMALALSPDGSRLAVGCRNEVVLFEVGPDSLKFLDRARAHLDPVQSIAWMPDGKQLVTGAFRRVVVWNTSPFRQEREISTGLTDRITALRALPDGRQVLLADGQVAESGIVRVVDVPGGEIVRSWPAHDDTIFAMALSGDGKLLATAGGDKLVKLWDVGAGTVSAKLEAHSTQVLSLGFNPDSSQLVTGGADRQLKVWDVKTRENTTALASQTTAFNAVLWSAAGPAVFAVTDDGSLLRYTDLKTHTGAQSSDTGNERVLGKAEVALYCLAATDSGERIFAGTSDGQLLGWNKDGKLLDKIDVVTAQAVAPAPP